MVRKAVLFELLSRAKCENYESSYSRCLDGHLWRWDGKDDGECKFCAERKKALEAQR